MKLSNSIASLFLILCLLSCKENKKNEETTDTGEKEQTMQTTVRLNWIPSCSFVGEMMAADFYDSMNNLEMKVEAGGPGLDPIKLIQAESNTFGVAGSDLVLTANEKGADLVIIGLVSYNSPGVWLAKKEKNINSIEDVKGKRIGELPGGNMQYLYEVFLSKTNLERQKDFEPVPIPFEIRNFIAQDECDLRPVFIYDEPSALKLAGIEYTLIEPKDYGIKFKGICYFTKRETVENNPKLVQAFINSVAKGWEEAISNPKKAIASLKNFDNSINEEKELLGLQTGLDYFKGYENKILYTDKDSWNQMATDMKELGFLKEIPSWDKVLQLSFINEYHQKVN